ncbi:MAG: hypothetical protein MK209_05075 [Planctomycetes bacterium]|nr:hypothetical protein [Planctomycetota bacterium]
MTRGPLIAVLSVIGTLGASNMGAAQGGLTKPPEPSGNPSTPEKQLLGQALFWDEQLSSSQSVACGSCHILASGGSDPRSFSPESRAPGFDGIFGTSDDIQGSLGLPLSTADGNFFPSAEFGFHPQVTGRKASPAINALLNTVLFWDGRAEFSYRNPVTGAVVLPAWAALESQAVEPVVSSIEMAFLGRDWNDVASDIAPRQALALSPSVPSALDNWIAGRNYDALFAEAFGSTGVDIDRIAMALAVYQRTLFSDQTPLDDFIRGNSAALTMQEQRGMALFQSKGRCIDCHSFPQTGRQQFHYTGVRPVHEDLGRGAITGNPTDDGKMLTPGLRNVALRPPYFHNGRTPDLRAVIDFYDRGGDFNHPNKSAQISPIGFTQPEKDDLLVFLRDALTDPRVESEIGPFERPLLRSEDPAFHQRYGAPSPNANGDAPQLVAVNPLRLRGEWRIGVADGPVGANSWIAVDTQPRPDGVPYLGVTAYLAGTPALRVFGPTALGADGHITRFLPTPSTPGLLGRTVYVQAFVQDALGTAGFTSTAAIATPILPAD